MNLTTRNLKCFSLLIAVFLLLAGCGQAGTPAKPLPTRKESKKDLRGKDHTPASYAYVLQAEKLAATRQDAVKVLARCGRDWIILDSAYTTGFGGRWTREEIRTIRAGKLGRKVIAYLSIGEAEDYRAYWQQAWDQDRNGKPDKDAPGFLVGENPDWRGNYRVRYWEAGWRKIIRKELAAIIDQGFDGVWLDVVDVFEFFEKKGKKYLDNRVNKVTGNTFRKDMLLFVLDLARVARKSVPGFLIIPQNASQLMADSEYRRTVSAIALEDLFTTGKRKQPRSHTAYVLTPISASGDWDQPVLNTEYCRKASLRDYCRKQASAHKILLLFTDRGLGRIGNAK